MEAWMIEEINKINEMLEKCIEELRIQKEILEHPPEDPKPKRKREIIVLNS